jgi:hypothetical protein
MWISCRFPTGEYFKYKILRYKTVLDFHLNVSNDGLNLFRDWVNDSKHPTYGAVFNRLHALCLVCNTGKDLINLIKKDNGTNS